ncbi:Maf family nucleotide pyrophosphatase [Thermophagus xiamenensis]|uniref:dTTP/UTP pyrophosphatase n=1 Tax=Thermophagus xiamenensis TaxID=385682 RepID=A0A1I1VUA5_9BACT|nr:Maf family nucleotide pyrophosphatase [Thermophagus xiamenensis]SFD86636.1 septum formation protein [Thermophagus xiamenensis]
MIFKKLESYNITLASGSPRRKEILEKTGIPFTIGRGRDVREEYPADLPIDQVALFLARLKADAWKDIWQQPNQMVITADTIVAIDNKVIGKPEDRDHAIQMLNNLSGRSHRVVTGVVIRTADKEKAFTDVTTVHFKPLAREEIIYYIDQYQPFDKAGAYGIQEWIGLIGIHRIEGSYFNVMGLPVSRLMEELRNF